MDRFQQAIDTASQVTNMARNMSSSVFRVKVFVIVGICTFILGLGIGLSGGIYFGYTKWTKKVDKLIDQSKQYRDNVVDKLRERIHK